MLNINKYKYNSYFYCTPYSLTDGARLVQNIVFHVYAAKTDQPMQGGLSAIAELLVTEHFEQGGSY